MYYTHVLVQELCSREVRVGGGVRTPNFTLGVRSGWGTQDNTVWKHLTYMYCICTYIHVPVQSMVAISVWCRAVDCTIVNGYTLGPLFLNSGESLDSSCAEISHVKCILVRKTILLCTLKQCGLIYTATTSRLYFGCVRIILCTYYLLGNEGELYILVDILCL